jgi:hypothetical protein
MRIIITLDNSFLLRRDHRLRPTCLDRRDEIITVRLLVHDRYFGIMTFDKFYILVGVRLLSAGQDELNRVAQSVDSELQLGPEPTSGASQGLVGVPFLTAPAACWWARIRVLSRISHSKSGSFIASKTRAQTPLADQRSNRLHTEFHLPKRSGMSRQRAPVLPIQRTA